MTKKSINNFISTYTNKLVDLLNNIDTESISEIIKTLNYASNSNNRIYIIGNGGSAATASHMVNDFGVGLKRKNLLSLDITSLADNFPTITAIGNDTSYDDIFYLQLFSVIKKEDILIAISCSGDSPNIIKAVNYAHDTGAKIIGVTGFDGGQLKKTCDISFHVPTQRGEYGLVEDMHMILDHIIYSYFHIKDGN